MDIREQITAIFDKHEVWTISISCRPEIIEEIADMVETIIDDKTDDAFNRGQIAERQIHFG